MAHNLRNELYRNIWILEYLSNLGAIFVIGERWLNFLVLSTLQSREIHENKCNNLKKKTCMLIHCMVFGLRSSVAFAANLLPLIGPLHKQFACFFLCDFPICKHPRNFVETFLLFLCLVLWVQYIVWKYFWIPQDLNHGTQMFGREYSVRQCSGNVAEEFLLFLMSLFFSLHEGSVLGIRAVIRIRVVPLSVLVSVIWFDVVRSRICTRRHRRNFSLLSGPLQSVLLFELVFNFFSLLCKLRTTFCHMAQSRQKTCCMLLKKLKPACVEVALYRRQVSILWPWSYEPHAHPAAPRRLQVAPVPWCTCAMWWLIPETGFDPVTSELWAPRASSAPPRWKVLMFYVTWAMTSSFFKAGELTCYRQQVSILWPSAYKAITISLSDSCKSKGVTDDVWDALPLSYTGEVLLWWQRDRFLKTCERWIHMASDVLCLTSPTRREQVHTTLDAFNVSI